MVTWTGRCTGRQAEWEIGSSGSAVELSSASSENDSHSWLPSKGVPHDGQGSLPAYLQCDIHTHTSSNRRAHIHLHTPTHTQSSAVSATRCMLSSLCRTHTKARISTIKLSAGQEAIPNHTPLSPSSPHHLIIIPLNSVAQILQDVTAVRSSVNALRQCYCFTALHRSDIRR